MATAKAKATAKRLTLARAVTPGGSRAVVPRKPTAPARVRPTSAPGVVVPPADPSGFRAAVTARRTPTVPVPGVVPGSTYRVPAPVRKTVVAPTVGLPQPARVAGPPAPNPKASSTHTLTGNAAKPLYHTPTPAPAPSRSPGSAAGAVRAPISAPTPAAPAVPTSATTAGRVASAISGVGTGISKAATGVPNAVAAAPVTAAPPPATPTPAAQAAPPAAAPDPYAAYPPEVAALLRANDETLAAQQRSLSGYFGNQAQAAQDFATAIGTQTGNLAQLAGIPVGAQNQATSGLPGAVTALPGALGTIAQHLGGAQGLSTTNAAAMVPGFLRTAGAQAQTTLASAGQKAQGETLQKYIDQQGQLAQTQAEQQGMDSRTAAQIGSNERIAAARNAVQSADATLTLLGHVLQAATSSGNAQLANQTRSLIADAQIQSQNARNVADNQTRLATNQNTVNAGLAKTAATTGAKAKADYGKTYAAAVKDFHSILYGDAGKPNASQRVSDGKGGSTVVKGWTDAAGNFSRTPPAGTLAEPQDVLYTLIQRGVKPRDAYNMFLHEVRRTSLHWKDPEVDLYNALGATPSARKLTLQITKLDPAHPAAGPPAPTG